MNMVKFIIELNPLSDKKIKEAAKLVRRSRKSYIENMLETHASELPEPTENK